MLTDGRTRGRPENIMYLPPIGGGGVKMVITFGQPCTFGNNYGCAF